MLLAIFWTSGLLYVPRIRKNSENACSLMPVPLPETIFLWTSVLNRTVALQSIPENIVFGQQFNVLVLFNCFTSYFFTVLRFDVFQCSAWS